MEPLVDARRLQKRFPGGRIALNDVSLTIRQGEKVCIVGPSGSGKTTLLRCLNLLVEPTAGQLYFRGDLVGEWPGRQRRPVSVQRHRQRIGFVFQHFELFPHLTALENLCLGPVNALHQSKTDVERLGRELLDRVGLAGYADARPRTLSGGQKQRVAIARALAMRPELILFDEPTSALDAEMVGEVLDLMVKLARDGMTMVVVTHELAFAREVADRLVVMESGAVLEEGPVETLFQQPSHKRTREILRLERGWQAHA